MSSAAKECQHPRIQNFKTLDGMPVPLWGCVDCDRRFEPTRPALEKEAARHRWSVTEAKCGTLNFKLAYEAWDGEGGPDGLAAVMDRMMKL